jgi:Ca-activated chloride channel family protein
MASGTSPRLSLWIVSALLVGACADPQDSANDRVGRPSSGGYGEERIGYKGASLSGANALRGGSAGEAAGGATSNGAATFSPSSPGGSFAGLSAPAPIVAPASDAGVLGLGDAALLDASVSDAAVDAQALADANLNDASPDASLHVKERPPQGATVLSPENPFHLTNEQATSTFAIDVDTGSYTLSRASISAGHLPDPNSVRSEEFLNYFHFHYAEPSGDAPFSLYTELGACPWNDKRKLLMLGIQGQEVALKDQPPANLVFLIDVSGSMNDPAKLPLLKKGFRMLTSQLRAQDRVAIVTYAGHESVALTSTAGDRKDLILAAIDRLESGGSTNGEGGIQKAYELAQQTFLKQGNNRVILATDGDFNVGLRQTDELEAFIATKRATGVYLSVYGFGAAWDGGNYKDAVGEQLADNGDGIYFYVDSPEEARRAFLESVSGSLLTVAKDVKLQVELNPAYVKAYRLIGYENRVLDNDAFNDDSADGGELGAGLSVTALFELILANTEDQVPSPLAGSVPELLSSESADAGNAETLASFGGDDWIEVRLRYKAPGTSTSKLMQNRYGQEIAPEASTPKFLFAAGVSELAMQLRRSQYLPVQRQRALLEQLALAKPLDRDGAIEELIQLAQQAYDLMR